MRSVLFRAPLEHYLEKKIHQFEIEQAGFEAFLTTYNDGRWVLMFKDEVDRSDVTTPRRVDAPRANVCETRLRAARARVRRGRADSR